MAKLSNKRLAEMYETMLTIRAFEEKAHELFQLDKVMGAIHLSVGQEACAVGAIWALDEGDYIVSNHRGHGHCIARGASIEKMFAELLGRRTGYCFGKGGSMHIADFDLNICGANGIVGAGLPITVGVALASVLKGDNHITLCSFGEGASNQGAFHEALNLASVWHLPIIFMCENNQYAVSTHVTQATNIENIADRSVAYGIEGVVVDGNDVQAVHDTIKKAAAKVRKGGGPVIVECKTYRRMGHFVGDACVYRPKEEAELWAREKDPIDLVGRRISAKVDLEPIQTRVAEQIDKAVAVAEAGPLPEPHEAADGVYAECYVEDTEPEDKGNRELTFRDTMTEALRLEMEANPDVFLIGEDIATHGGGFAVTKGLSDLFGKERVRDTPISEAAIMGAANGAATRGLRPIVEIMYSDFTTIAMDQICNQAAKMHYMFGGKMNVPIVVRTPGGSGGRGNAAQHSQSLEAWFMHVPGLKVAIPSTPFDAKGLLAAAAADENPVLFIEHKVLYVTTGPVPEQRYCIPLGKADVKREGSDVTIVSYSRMALRSLDAAVKAAAEGIDVEVVDCRSLVPLDVECIVESVRKTNRLIVVEEDCKTAGVGAEIITRVLEEAFDDLDAPPVRVAGLDVPIPYSKPLEHASVPSEDDILGAIREIVG